MSWWDTWSDTLQKTNISHLGKRKIIDSKVPAGREYVSSQQGYCFVRIPLTTKIGIIIGLQLNRRQLSQHFLRCIKQVTGTKQNSSQKN